MTDAAAVGNSSDGMELVGGCVPTSSLYFEGHKVPVVASDDIW